MSRVGSSPVPHSETGSRSRARRDGQMQVKGPKGTALRAACPPQIDDRRSSGRSLVEARASRRQQDGQAARCTASLGRYVANMVKGVTERVRQGVLEIQGVGYRAEVEGKKLNLTARLIAPGGDGRGPRRPEGVGGPQRDRQDRGDQPPAKGGAVCGRRPIAIRPPEPYKGKGIRYVGEHVRRKVGKAGVTAGG